jgi:hypothetical protein
MDRIVDAMGKAGIKVIMGTPNYSIPTWMWKEHPEILARPLGGASVGYPSTSPLFAPIGYLPKHRPTEREWSWAVDTFRDLKVFWTRPT